MSSTPTSSQPEEYFDETEEYQLIRDLSNFCCHNLRVPDHQSQAARATSRRKNEVRTLNFWLRNALTRPGDLQLVIDRDWVQDDKDVDDAQQILADLCDVLERLCGQLNPDLSGRSGRYIKLSALLKHLEYSANTRYDVISVSGHHPALFSCHSNSDLVKAINVVKRFNRFLNQVNQSSADIDLGEPTGVSFTYATPSVKIKELSSVRTNLDGSGNCHGTSDEGLEGCFQHARTALRVLLSRLSTCSQERGRAHNLLIQLPTVEEIISQNRGTNNGPLKLFLSACTDSSQWQEAQVIFNTVNDTAVFDPCRSICDEVERALWLKDGLLFRVQHPVTNSVEEDLRIATTNENMEPTPRDLKPDVSLQKLIDDDFLKPAHITLKRLTSNMKGCAASAAEKMALAIQILFGVVLCLRYDSNMSTWDSTRVFILATERVHDFKIPPYISAVQSDDGISFRELWNSQATSSFEMYSCQTFTRIAKLLLEIASGECLNFSHTGTDGNDKELWKKLSEMVQRFKKCDIGDESNSIEMIPYFVAADQCLRFDRLYRTEFDRLTNSMLAEKVSSEQVVEHIVSNLIIPKLSQKAYAEPEIISMESIIKARSAAKGSMEEKQRPIPDHLMSRVMPSPFQRNIVKLFDGSSQISRDHLLVDRAESFFTNLDDFQLSFGSFLEAKGSKTNEPIRIAILDTGINKGSVAINFDGNHMKDEWCVNFVDGAAHDDHVHDEDGHGTHCAALVQKAAPNADIYIAKVFSHDTFDLNQAQNISKAIRHATDIWDVHIISMSFGLDLPSSKADMERWRKIKNEIGCAIELARPRLLFAAASNEGKNRRRAFPSTHPSVFCVHASDGLGNDCGINPYHDGAENNIMALGAGIELYDDKAEDFVYKVGTSFATAIAAGMVASILDLTSRVPSLNERSKAVLKKNEGMKVLFRLMSEHNRTESRPYLAPWRYWQPSVWNVDSRGLDAIWAELDSRFFQFDCK